MKPIPGHEKYLVSETGEVFSTVSNRLLKQMPFNNGYFGLNLGVGKRHLVHRLVALAYVPNPNGKPQVNHKDGNRANNAAENLEWVTCSENHCHSYRELTRKPHAKTRRVNVGGTLYESALAASKALGVVAGSIASAALRGHCCKGMEVRYV